MVQKSISIPFWFAVGSAGSLSPKSTAIVENIFRSIVREEVDAQLKAHSVDVEEGKEVVGNGGGSGGTNENLWLCLMNRISSTIYTANDIEAENGEELRVELFDGDHIIDCLGNRLSERKWKAMVKQALRYVPSIIPTSDSPNLQENAGMDQNEVVLNQNIDASSGNYEFQYGTFLGSFQDLFHNNPIFEDYH
uniref:Uncharacterized protein n=1 Tax=Cucumis sativus TaxID=3659 RepID=A0A0A0LVX8_CUCSA